MSLLIRAAALARSVLLRRGAGIGPRARAELYRRIWEEAARELGGELRVLPDGFFEVRLGERITLMREHHVMLDHPASVDLSRSKALVHQLLSENGLPVPDFREFDIDQLTPAIEFLQSVDGPCVIKPARDSAGGDGVTTNVRTPRDLRRAALAASLVSRNVLIERQIPGDVYRLLYLDGILLDALRRRPPTVVGDGRSSIRQLIEAENRRRVEKRGLAANKRITLTEDCRRTLDSARWSLRSVPPAGVEVIVKTATNESAESDSESVLDSIGNPLRAEGARAASVLGIRLAGLDVITADPGESLTKTGGKIIEVNATPGLHYHYQTRDPRRSVAVAVPILRCLLGAGGR